MVAVCEGGLTRGSQDDRIYQFWSVWLEIEDRLYSCCVKLMNWNKTDAEDALSQAKIKAWEQWEKHAGKIKNLRAWLVRLTINLCKDIIEKNSRGPTAVEDIEWVGDDGVLCTVSSMPSPEKALETLEMSQQIRRAIASLPQRQRDAFVLHFYEELKHTEIAERLGISYDSVCKRLSLARQGLKRMLRGYFCDEEELGKTVSTAPDGAVGKEKSDLMSGTVEQKDPVGSSRKEGSVLGLASKLSPTPLFIVDKQNILVIDTTEMVSASPCTASDVCCDVVQVRTQLDASSPVVAPVASGEQLLCSLPVLDIVGQNLLDVSGKGSAREPSPPGIVEKRTLLLGIAPAEVEAKQVGVVPPWVSPVCTWLDARSPGRPPVASGEDRKPGFSEDFSHRDRDISYNPVSQGPPDKGNGSARSRDRSPPAIAVRLALRALRIRSPLFGY